MVSVPNNESFCLTIRIGQDFNRVSVIQLMTGGGGGGLTFEMFFDQFFYEVVHTVGLLMVANIPQSPRLYSVEHEVLRSMRYSFLKALMKMMAIADDIHLKFSCSCWSPDILELKTSSLVQCFANIAFMFNGPEGASNPPSPQLIHFGCSCKFLKALMKLTMALSDDDLNFINLSCSPASSKTPIISGFGDHKVLIVSCKYSVHPCPINLIWWSVDLVW